MLDLDSLNPEQRNAVENFFGPLMILAGAGTGKTRVISFRIAYMLANGIQPESVVALTFTNKAAREMAERVKDLAGKTKAKKLFLGTFHSFCLMLLRKYAKEAGLDNHFTLVGTSDQIDLVRKSLEERHWNGLYDVETLHSQISRAKNYLLSPDDLRNRAPSSFGFYVEDPSLLAEVYDLYERQLALHRAIDFDDCIYKCVRLIKQNPKVKEELHKTFQYFLVDEFQDTNLSQLSLLEEVVNSKHNICVVGDDDQSIYSWRGAMYETLERFEEIFPKTRLVKLEQNYRCTNIILHAANTVIKNNSRRKSKTLWSSFKSQTPITIAALPDEAAEARWISEKILAYLGQEHQFRDIGILYRANAQARAIELAFREHRLSYKTFGGTSFFERKEVKDFLCFLRLVVNPNDRLAFWRIINTPPRGIGLKTLEKIEEFSKTHNISPLGAVLTGKLDLNSKSQKALDDFVASLKILREAIRQSPDDIESLGKQIIHEFRLEEDIKLKTSHQMSRQRKLENLRSLPGWLKQSASDLLDKKGELDLKGLVDHLTLDDSDRKGKDDKDLNQISLMTIHAAKGLEFPIVFVCGVEEDLLPHKNSALDPNGIAEERRLFYVALTRAKERLHLSYAQQRATGFQRQERLPSRFIKELPEAGLSKEAEQDLQLTAEQRHEKRKEQTISKLSSLREKLLDL